MDGPVAGPSRLPRALDPTRIDRTDRGISIQRRDAGPSRGPQRRAEPDEYSRGPSQPARRALFDPTRSVPAPRVASPLPLDIPARSTPPPPSPSRHRDAPGHTRRRPESPARGIPSRKLFDPTTHDPHQFSRPPENRPEPALALRRLPRTAEEEADKERERRRRKEGSERGSGSSGRKKEESKSRSARSLGDRSSEGSESFKDRDRGKGKGDTGVKAILKDIHDRIKAIEMDLTEMHRKLAVDPEAGIAVLLDRNHLTPTEDAALWLDLIGKHKQLWQNGFHLILERLRHSWMTGHPTALDLLTDFVYDGYKFYTDLLEDVALGGFRTAWIEALGDLARYRMAIARLASEGKGKDSPRDDASGERWEVEDTDTWRQTASDWYSMGITEKPGEGRLHHHLALLARDMPEEGRALHHFTRSLVVTHEFPSARESILGLFDLANQRRSEKRDEVVELFIRLHGMLFTRIELDRFDETLRILQARLEDREIGQVEWMIMAAVGIAGMMQYGSSDGILRKALAQEGAERRKNQASPEGDDSEDWPLSLTCAFRLAFTIFSHTLRHPTVPQGVHHILNPYLTTMLTFLATLARQPATATIIIPWMPWSDLTSFVTTPPLDIKPETKLVSGQPIPEDWLLRGAEWVGRRVYERGFWKVKPSSGRGSGGMAQPTQRSGERFGSEMDVLLAHYETGVDVSQGVVDAESVEVDGPVEVGRRRWRRVGWALGVMSNHIPGLDIDDARVVISEPLKSMIKEERKVATIPVPKVELREEEQEEPREDDDPELAILRDRFKHLQSLVSTSHRSPLRIIQGYTTLIFDTNVLLSSLTLVARLIESGKWTVVIPLPVLTELDGLAKEAPPLGIEAVKAISYLEANVKRNMVLRIQTTKGSYLSDLRLRTEAADIIEADRDRKTMDDKILDVARWQLDHFVDRSLMLGGAGPRGEASKAVLVTFDRNLRLRARAAGVEAVDEREMADILGK